MLTETLLHLLLPHHLWHPWIPPYLLIHTYLVYISHPGTIQSSTAFPRLPPEPSVAWPVPLKQRAKGKAEAVRSFHDSWPEIVQELRASPS